MKHYDVVVIGAGIQGAGVAQAAAAAGYNVLVLEKKNIAAGTSCRSSKLIHGGLRYLESGQFSLVRKSLKERAILCKIAPDLVNLIPFYIPIYKTTKRRSWQIWLGLAVYAILGHFQRHNVFRRLHREEINKLNHLNKVGLQEVYQYYDGQTNDKNLTCAVMQSALQLGATLKYPVQLISIDQNFKWQDLTKCHIIFHEHECEHEVVADVLVNAAGPWVDEVHLCFADKIDKLKIELVQGTHIIIDAPAPEGIYYLEANDHRAVFVMPYKVDNIIRTLIGTTETIFQGMADDVVALDEDVNYLSALYEKYFPDVNFTVIDQFAGLRVLLKTNNKIFSRSRETVLHWTAKNCLTIYGGKLTAYRATANDVIKKLKPLLKKSYRIAYTHELLLAGIEHDESKMESN